MAEKNEELIVRLDQDIAKRAAGIRKAASNLSRRSPPPQVEIVRKPYHVSRACTDAADFLLRLDGIITAPPEEVQASMGEVLVAEPVTESVGSSVVGDNFPRIDGVRIG